VRTDKTDTRSNLLAGRQISVASKVSSLAASHFTADATASCKTMHMSIISSIFFLAVNSSIQYMYEHPTAPSRQDKSSGICKPTRTRNRNSRTPVQPIDWLTSPQRKSQPQLVSAFSPNHLSHIALSSHMTPPFEPRARLHWQLAGNLQTARGSVSLYLVTPCSL
jgi:hypothetical protein